MTQKLERAVLFLFFLLLPSQFAYHFWPPWSLLNGLRVDYLSPTLCSTDLLILCLFLLSRLKIKVPLFVIIFFALNLLISSSPFVTLYSWLRLLEYFWLFKYLTNKSFALSTLHLALPLALIWTSLLTWWQFFKQSSIGGPLYWLGERTFDITTPGIAKIAIDGHLLLRPYATLPHPNALAGFLLVAGLILVYLNTSPLSFPSPEFRRGARGEVFKILAFFSLILASLTVPLTFSRSAIFLELLLLSLWLFSKFKTAIVTRVVLVLLLTTISFLLSTKIGSPSSLPDRLALIRNSLFVIRKAPILGVGLGNFIPAAANRNSLFVIRNSILVTQPVHNIYLLLASELGLPAALLIGYWIIRKLKKILNIEYWILNIALVVVLTTGLADHYWLTLHQNSLLLTILISLIVVNSISQRMTTE